VLAPPNSSDRFARCAAEEGGPPGFIVLPEGVECTGAPCVSGCCVWYELGCCDLGMQNKVV